MRHIRVLATVAVLAAAISQPSAAQEGRQFKDAWFWGVKGGVTVWGSQVTTDNAGAPQFGADWLITRTRGGLYVSFDESILTAEAYFTTPGQNGFTDPRVSMQNQHRFVAAAMAFPAQSNHLHPYIGAGVGVHRVSSYAYQTSFASSAQFNLAGDSVQSRKVAIAPVIIAGLQARVTRFSVFGQALASFLPNNYLLRHSAPKRGLSQFSIERGIRYNVGSSIDKIR
jgi:opacity protein-like surface antigen